MKKKSLGLNALLNGIRTVLNTLFPLITFPYISRVLSVENVGKYNFALSVIQYFLLIAALGISTYAVREGTKFRDDKKKFSIFANEIFTINIISTITAYILLVFTVAAVPKFKDYAVIIAVFSIEILFTTIGTECIVGGSRSIRSNKQFVTKLSFPVSNIMTFTSLSGLYIHILRC